MEELQVILGADKGRNAFYKARDNFAILQEFANNANDNFIELYNTGLYYKGWLHSFLTSGQSLNILPNGIYGVTGWFDFVDRPLAYEYRKLIISSSKNILGDGLNTAYYIPHGANEIWLRQGWNTGYGTWIKILTDKQPDWIAATLQNGWTGTLQYRKNQIGQLEMVGSLVAGTIAWGVEITTLPTGYKPIITSPITVFGASGRNSTNLTLLDSGILTIYDNNLATISPGDIVKFNIVLN